MCDWPSSSGKFSIAELLDPKAVADFIAKELKIAIRYGRQEPYVASRIPRVRPCWVVQLSEDRKQEIRIALTGHNCPTCKFAQVDILRTSSKEPRKLACLNPWCDFVLQLASGQNISTGREIERAKITPLKEDASPNLIREWLILAHRGYSIDTGVVSKSKIQVALAATFQFPHS